MIHSHYVLNAEGILDPEGMSPRLRNHGDLASRALGVARSIGAGYSAGSVVVRRL